MNHDDVNCGVIHQSGDANCDVLHQNGDVNIRMMNGRNLKKSYRHYHLPIRMQDSLQDSFLQGQQA